MRAFAYARRFFVLKARADLERGELRTAHESPSLVDVVTAISQQSPKRQAKLAAAAAAAAAAGAPANAVENDATESIDCATACSPSESSSSSDETAQSPIEAQDS